MCAKLLQLCLTLCNSTDYSLPCSSVCGILQARILEWVAIPFSRGSSWPKDQTWVSSIAGCFFTIWTTREAPGNKGSHSNSWSDSDWVPLRVLSCDLHGQTLVACMCQYSFHGLFYLFQGISYGTKTSIFKIYFLYLIHFLSGWGLLRSVFTVQKFVI